MSRRKRPPAYAALQLHAFGALPRKLHPGLAQPDWMIVCALWTIGHLVALASCSPKTVWKNKTKRPWETPISLFRGVARFGFCQTPSVLKSLEEWSRRRLRCMVCKQWRRAHGVRADLIGRCPQPVGALLRVPSLDPPSAFPTTPHIHVEPGGLALDGLRNIGLLPNSDGGLLDPSPAMLTPVGQVGLDRCHRFWTAPDATPWFHTRGPTSAPASADGSWGTFRKRRRLPLHRSPRLFQQRLQSCHLVLQPGHFTVERNVPSADRSNGSAKAGLSLAKPVIVGSQELHLGENVQRCLGPFLIRKNRRLHTTIIRPWQNSYLTEGSKAVTLPSPPKTISFRPVLPLSLLRRARGPPGHWSGGSDAMMGAGT